MAYKCVLYWVECTVSTLINIEYCRCVEEYGCRGVEEYGCRCVEIYRFIGVEEYGCIVPSIN